MRRCGESHASGDAGWWFRYAFLLFVTSVFMSGCGAEQTAAPDTSVEEPRPVETTAEPERTTTPPPPPPQPKGYEERVRAALTADEINAESIERIRVKDGEGGCKNVTVKRLAAENWAADPDYVEQEMGDTYAAIYSKEQLASKTCGMTVNVWGDLIDKYGNRSNKRIYSTAMDRATAKNVNWQNQYSVDFSQIWRVNYKHPAVDQALLEQQLKQAADCAEDEGLFDMDVGCP